MVLNSGYWPDWSIKANVVGHLSVVWLWRLIMSLVQFNPSMLTVKQLFNVSQFSVVQWFSWSCDNIVQLNWQKTNNIATDPIRSITRVPYHQLTWYNSLWLWSRLSARHWKLAVQKACFLIKLLEMKGMFLIFLPKWASIGQLDTLLAKTLLWRWLPHRLLKCQSLSTIVLFRTTFTHKIILNLLMNWLLGSNVSQCYKARKQKGLRIKDQQWNAILSMYMYQT